MVVGAIGAVALCATFSPAPVDAAPYTSDEMKALTELSKDLERFKNAAGDYRTTVNNIVKRAYEFRRKKLIGGFDKKIRKEETEERTRRIAAITLFEDFLRRYPNDKRWTPDVIFRLAELYFEKSNDQYLTSTEDYENDLKRFEKKELAAAPTPPKQNYQQTIDLHRRLISEFPRYRLVDGAYYLLGFCLTEMGQEENGNKAFLSLVCSNRFKPPLVDKAPGDDTAADAPEKKPLISARTPAQPEALKTDAYNDCVELKKKSRFNAEGWTRVGEYHFDENQLGPAIAAYRRVLDLGPKNNPYYDEALYKLAWTYYRADKFQLAIKHFDDLVVYSDKEYEKTGKYGSEMRPESIQYLGISFAESDWDGDTVPDPETGIQRIEKFYGPRIKEKHVYEVYQRLGQIYFDTTKYEDAVKVYKLMLKSWPYRATNPDIQDKVIMALERQRKFNDAIKEREEFTRLFGKGTEWEKRNQNNTKALKKAREFDEQALIQAAVFHHKAGQELKKRGMAMSDGAKLQQAAQEYALAAKTYRKYLDRFPDTKNSYEIRYSYASCLFYSQRFLEAAVAFAEVRDSNLDDRFRDESAFSAAKAYEKYLRLEIAAGRLTEPKLPDPKTRPASLTKIPMPEAFKKWQHALDMYGKVLPKSPKTPQVIYNAAAISYRFLHFDDARKRFGDIFEKYCKSKLAVNAAQAILVTFQLEKNLDKMEVWATKMTKDKCVAGGVGKEALAGTAALLDGIKFKRARSLHAKGDELTKAGRQNEAAGYYDKAAVAYLALVDSSPDSKDADKALNNAAVCYEGSRRFESATKIYERVWQKYPKSSLAGESLWRAAVNYQRFFEFSKAVQNYLILADSPRFTSSPRRTTAVFNAAVILENDQAYARAAKLFLRYADSTKEKKEAAEAYFRAGMIFSKMNDFGKMVKIFRAFPRKYGSVKGQASHVIEASFRIAKGAQKRNDWRTAERYYRQSIIAFTGQKAGSEAADFAANAAFQIAEKKLEKFLKKELKGSLKAIAAGRKRLEKEAISLKQEYERIWDYKRAQWTLGSMYRAGTIMEHVAKSVAKGFREAPIPRKVKRLGQDAIDIYQGQVDQLLEQQVRPLEDASKKLYEACVNKAKGFGVSNKYTEEASKRLNAFDPVGFPLLKRAKVDVVME